MPLRNYQLQALDKVQKFFDTNYTKRKVLLVSPTGSGKTATAAEAVRRAISQGKKVLWLAHRRELITQASQRLAKDGIPDHGVLLSGYPAGNKNSPLQIASVDTLRVRGIRPPADLIIWDEAHHVRANTWVKIQNEYPEAYSIGLTATPCRGDGAPLGDVFDGMVVAATIRQLQKAGYLVPCRIIAPSKGLSGKKLARDPLHAWQAKAQGKQTVVFLSTLQECYDLAHRFKEAGAKAAVVEADTPAEERTEILERFAAKELDVLCNVAVLTEGWDCLDRETEILTSQGWKGYGQVAEGDLIYALNRETEKLEIVPVESYGERHLRAGERMVSLTSQSVNIRTTEGHQFHIKYRDPAKRGSLSDEFITKTGTELVERRSSYALPLSAPLSTPFSGIPLSNDEIRFIAWFLTDGYLDKTYVSISQSKHYKDEIRELLQRLGFSFTERTREPGLGSYPNAQPCTEFNVPKGNQGGMQARNGWVGLAPYLDKRMSHLLHQMTREQFLVFWDELLKGNGEKQVNKSGWLWTRWKEQADTLTWMAIVRGLSASYSTRITKNNVLMYRISVRDAQWITSDPSDSRAAKIKFEDPNPDEIVWCVKNKHSTLVTRRQGKIAIIGNCPGAEVGIVARSVGSLGLWMQIVGRFLRPSPGKKFATVLDLAGNVHQHGLPEAEMNFSLDGGIVQKPEGRMRSCPYCGVIITGFPCPHCGKGKKPVLKVKIEEMDIFEILRPVPPADGRTDKRRQREDALYLARYAAHQRLEREWIYVMFQQRHGRNLDFDDRYNAEAAHQKTWLELFGEVYDPQPPVYHTWTMQELYKREFIDRYVRPLPNLLPGR